MRPTDGSGTTENPLALVATDTLPQYSVPHRADPPPHLRRSPPPLRASPAAPRPGAARSAHPEPLSRLGPSRPTRLIGRLKCSGPPCRSRSIGRPANPAKPADLAGPAAPAGAADALPIRLIRPTLLTLPVRPTQPTLPNRPTAARLSPLAHQHTWGRAPTGRPGAGSPTPCRSDAYGPSRCHSRAVRHPSPAPVRLHPSPPARLRALLRSAPPGASARRPIGAPVRARPRRRTRLGAPASAPPRASRPSVALP